MGVKYYGPGDHPAGFIGFRAHRVWSDKKPQEYFSTRKAKIQDESDPHFLYQKKLAYYTDAQWEVESLWYQYQKFVTTNNKLTHPYRGVGVHSLIMTFARWNDTDLAPCFQVFVTGKKSASRSYKRFYLRHHLFSEAWELAVNAWAEENEILEEDRVRVLNNPPSPEQFKDLRRHMNENEGYDIPVEALRPVFREQREALQHKRLAEHARLHKHDQPKPMANNERPADIERDMLAWFEEANAS
ncbi:MAG: hypothetical protein AWU57_280 [Marinobacter sp. T13-3]|nr:MAG: hypothetical protein AWU57_280 [Marinobacter sp. T13-3]